MPDRILTKEDDRISIEKWLEKNYSDKIGFIPCKENFKDYYKDKKDIFDKKGIYFWFLNEDGYKKLHEFVETKIPGVNLKLNNEYKRIYNSTEYTLVYIGLAGAFSPKKNTDINKATLYSRINDEHLAHGKKSSTFRDTIGPLINNSFGEDYDDNINVFLRKYFKLHVIGYGYRSDYLKIYKKIQDDEKVLIERIMPVFNFYHNPNARNNDHVTWKIKKIRNEFREEYFPKSKKSESKTHKKKDPRINKIKQIKECNFIFKGENYILKKVDKWILLENGKKKNCKKTIIREYIELNNLKLSIPLFNKYKKEKDTNHLCSDFLNYMNSIKI
jgi:hypothetical protein